MVRRLKPTDAGYAALLLSGDLDAPPLECSPLDAALLCPELDEPNCELCSWGEGAEVVHIDSSAGVLDSSGLGFVPGWSQKKGD